MTAKQPPLDAAVLLDALQSTMIVFDSVIAKAEWAKYPGSKEIIEKARKVLKEQLEIFRDEVSGK